MGTSKNHAPPSPVSDITFDLSIYRFVLSGLLVSLFATVIRFIFVWHFGSDDILRFDGAPLGILMESSLGFLLWRRPQSLRTVVKIVYWYLAVGISVKLIFLLLWNAGALYSELLWMIPWMFVSFVLPFFQTYSNLRIGSFDVEFLLR